MAPKQQKFLRMARRKTSLEEKNCVEFFNAEFLDDNGQPELDASVYALDTGKSRATQIYAEHAANAGLDPPKPRFHFDVSGIFEDQILHAPLPKSFFEYIKNAHHEYQLSDAAQLTELCDRILRESDTRGCPVSKADLQSYVYQRLAAEDPEWKNYCSQHNKGAKWEKFANKGAPRPQTEGSI